MINCSCYCMFLNIFFFLETQLWKNSVTLISRKNLPIIHVVESYENENKSRKIA